jgi:hypothetical protein
MPDDQELCKVSHACVLGMISRHKRQHAKCENRVCECHCHNDGSMYQGSWHRPTLTRVQ